MEITNIRNGEDELLLNAGEYVFVDPCYIFGEPRFQWRDMCRQVFCAGEDSPRGGTYSVEGHTVLWGQTAYGDGAYPMSAGLGTVSVDAGVICIVPKALYDLLVTGDEAVRLAKHLGHLTLAEDARICVQDGDWTIRGNIVLSTSGEEERCPRCGREWCDGECGEDENDEE